MSITSPLSEEDLSSGSFYFEDTIYESENETINSGGINEPDARSSSEMAETDRLSHCFDRMAYHKGAISFVLPCNIYYDFRYKPQQEKKPWNVSKETKHASNTLLLTQTSIHTALSHTEKYREAEEAMLKITAINALSSSSFATCQSSLPGYTWPDDGRASPLTSFAMSMAAKLVATIAENYGRDIYDQTRNMVYDSQVPSTVVHLIRACAAQAYASGRAVSQLCHSRSVAIAPFVIDQLNERYTSTSTEKAFKQTTKALEKSENGTKKNSFRVCVDIRLDKRDAVVEAVVSNPNPEASVAALAAVPPEGSLFPYVYLAIAIGTEDSTPSAKVYFANDEGSGKEIKSDTQLAVRTSTKGKLSEFAGSEEATFLVETFFEALAEYL